MNASETPHAKRREEMLAHATKRLLLPLGVFDLRGRVTVFVLVLLALAGGAAWIIQLRRGLAATAMTDYFSWGVYIVNFVFFIGLSMAGTLISAILHLSKAPWRAPITRMAECITVCALLIAGGMIMMDMGRPDRMLFVLIHARVQSPILWDVLSLNTYLVGSALYLYLALVPDIALLRDQKDVFSPWRQRFYRILALGWKGTPAQHARIERLTAIMALTIIPVAVSIHTVTAWLFGLTLRPGWHSSIIGPDFVVGAIFSGSAAVIVIMALFRSVFRLGRYITPFHFRKLASLLLVADIAYAYFMLNEYIGGLYTKEEADNRLMQNLFHGAYSFQFWIMFIVGLGIPAVLLIIPRLRTVKFIVAAALLVNVGMWLKRYIIVVPTLASPFMPAMSQGKFIYRPSWVEWAISAGGFAIFGLLFILFSKFFPVVSIWELQDEVPGEEPLPEHAPVQAKAITTATALLVLLLTPAFIRAGDSAAASAPVASAPAPVITLEARKEGSENLIIATVTADGKPAAGVTLEFFVARSFGRLNLGHDTTLPDGTAAVPFPAGLPGGKEGKLSVRAEVTTPADMAGAADEALIATQATAPASDVPVRELWSRRPPRLLLATVLLIVTLVWGIYAGVFLNLLKLRQEAQP